jgi:multiple sugar transport system ATP-binding protein
MAHVRLEGISKAFGGEAAVSDLDLDIEDGQFFVLLGPTGAGKTTTLRLIAGLERPDSGAVYIDHQNVNRWSPAQRDVALVLQQFSLYPRYTVRENLEFPLKSPARRLARSTIADRVARAAAIVRVEHLMDRKTDRLSGGEMQRVSIGRAIVRQPRIFLMDEPLSNLDAKLREALRAELKDLKIKLGATFLFVTHDQIEAMSMADRIAVLHAGRIAQVGTPYEMYNEPSDVFVAGFVGTPTMNLLKAEIRDGIAVATDGRFQFKLDGGARERFGGANGPLTVGIRAEDIRIGPHEAIEAIAHGVENQGVEKIVTLRINDCLLRATVPAAYPIAIEERIRFSFVEERLHGFDAKTGLNLRPKQQ